MLRTQQLNQFSPTTSVIQQKRQAMFSKGNLAPGIRDTTTSLISTRPPTEASQLEAARSLQSLSESPYYTSTIDVPMRPDNHVSDITELKVKELVPLKQVVKLRRDLSANDTSRHPKLLKIGPNHQCQ